MIIPINTVDDWLNINNITINEDSTIQLQNDIDFTGYDIPITNITTTANVVLDGQGYSFRNLRKEVATSGDDTSRYTFVKCNATNYSATCGVSLLNVNFIDFYELNHGYGITILNSGDNSYNHNASIKNVKCSVSTTNANGIFVGITTVDNLILNIKSQQLANIVTTYTSGLAANVSHINNCHVFLDGGIIQGTVYLLYTDILVNSGIKGVGHKISNADSRGDYLLLNYRYGSASNCYIFLTVRIDISLRFRVGIDKVDNYNTISTPTNCLVDVTYDIPSGVTLDNTYVDASNYKHLISGVVIQRVTGDGLISTELDTSDITIANGGYVFRSNEDKGLTLLKTFWRDTLGWDVY